MDNYLVHHGILGQRWGVRRYQNKDGSLTPAGKKRINNSEGTPLKEKIAKRANPAEIYNHRDLFTDKELNDLINRIKKEQELKRLIPEDEYVEKRKKGEEFSETYKKKKTTAREVIDGYSKFMKTSSDAMSNTYNAMSNFAKLYEGSKAMSGWLSGKEKLTYAPFKKIESGSNNNNNNNNNNNGNNNNSNYYNVLNEINSSLKAMNANSNNSSSRNNNSSSNNTKSKKDKKTKKLNLGQVKD